MSTGAIIIGPSGTGQTETLRGAIERMASERGVELPNIEIIGEPVREELIDPRTLATVLAPHQPTKISAAAMAAVMAHRYANSGKTQMMRSVMDNQPSREVIKVILAAKEQMRKRFYSEHPECSRNEPR